MSADSSQDSICNPFLPVLDSPTQETDSGLCIAILQVMRTQSMHSVCNFIFSEYKIQVMI